MPPKKTSAAPRPPARDRGVLTPDHAIRFPEFLLLAASAGSGKTHALSLRFVQFLLSEQVRRLSPNDLSNILAITFTRNASREMKQRILDWLKNCHFGNADALREVQALVSGTPEALKAAAGERVDRILTRYSDFQVDTIDSFTASVFRASAVDLGVSPDYEVTLQPSELITYAFSRFIRRIKPGTPEGRDFEQILDLLQKNRPAASAFDWDPAARIREKIDSLYGKLAIQNKPLAVEDLAREKAAREKDIKKAGQELLAVVDGARLEKNLRGHCFKKILPCIESGDFAGLLEASFKTAPVAKPSTGGRTARGSKDSVAGAEAYAKALSLWEKLASQVKDYRRLYARSFFYPYLLAYRSFAGTLDRVKRERGIVFIDDINKRLAGYIEQGIVPDIYFRLGERVFHFLIDEFQDTSPMQWANLVPLIENSLAQAGSLFLVGDTKQAIYGFRDADYRIMKDLEQAAQEVSAGRDPGPLNPFPSVPPVVRALETNYRCRREILDFVNSKFSLEAGASPGADEDGQGEDEGDGAAGGKEKYRKYLVESGFGSFKQHAAEKFKEPGHVEYVMLHREAEPAPEAAESAAVDNGEPAPPPDEAEFPEKREVQERVKDLHARGFSWADIAILAYRNETVRQASSWLNEIGVPFIPHSSLDIRRRKVVAEIFALLQFLDSPPDDLSFAAFLLGDVLKERIGRDSRPGQASAFPGDLPAEWHRFLFECRLGKKTPLYGAFRLAYPALWDRYFERLFKIVGYYPLYDLVALTYRIFGVFELFPEEEASLARLLEAIKDFEGQGRNDLREFLTTSASDGGDPTAWTIDVPPAIEAVKVMSIHKAKGLTFPAVILLLYPDRPPAAEFYFEQDKDADSVRVLKLGKAIVADDPRLGEIYEDAQTREKVGRLNALYVAMTRAAYELQVIGVTGKRQGYPFDFLGTRPFVSKNAAGRPLTPAERPRAPQRKAEAEPPRAEALRFGAAFELPLNPRQTLNRDNIRRGEIAHALLAEVEYVEAGWEADLAAAQARLRPEESESPVFEDVRLRLARFFPNSGLAPLFERRPGRRVFREFEVCDANGRLRRLDRVVVDAGEVTVVEFKTGLPSEPGRRKPWEEEDRRIFKSYLQIMSDIHAGKTVRGVFAWLDRGTLEAVS